MTKFCFSVILFAYSAFAQEDFKNKIVEPLQKNNLYFEKAFVHTNKTTYLDDDVIWFQAYVADNNNLPSNKTTLLYVNLTDSGGQVIASKNIFISNGIGVGEFDIANINGSGQYFIQAYTNNMRNFGDANFFIKEINVIKEPSVTDKSIRNEYDIQFFPESGYLLDDTENVLGIKLLTNGKGTDFTGRIINSKNQEITRFKNKYSGLSSCKFKYASGESYQAIIETNDTIIKLKIPESEKRELLLAVDNSNQQLEIELKAPEKLVQELNKHNFTLLFHQNHTIIDYFQIDPKSMINKKIEIDKQQLKNGVNTITLFKNYEPIAERKFYIDNQLDELSVSLEKDNSKNDSIVCNLKILNKDKPLKSRLSISVLPESTADFNETTTIKSAFLLTPYVTGYIENPGYYFDPKNPKRLEHLDLLLLTQGFVRYSFTEMVTAFNPKPVYEFELGFKLKGTVSPLATNYLGLIAKNNTLIQKIYLKNSNSFEFNKLLLYRNDAVKISFLSAENEAFQPEKIRLNTVEKSTFPKINRYKISAPKKELFTEKQYEEYKYYYGTRLNEITIKSKKSSKNSIRLDKLAKKYRSKVFDIGAYYEIEMPEDSRKNNELFMSFFLRNQGIRMVNWKGIEDYLEVSYGTEAALYVNGRRITATELSTLSLKMKDVEAVMKQPFKNYIKYQVFTNERYNNDIVELFDEFIVTNAYDRSKKYYTPAFNHKRPSGFMEMDWKTNLTTDNNGRSAFKIVKTDVTQKTIFSIQGLSEDGVLISEIIVK
ncbi:hypothetical protein FEDK69T_05630 [Flavobacterium enshiense DK69]|uniref:Macroglobulin domain-containing protein n=1 Tax=Flavobacterium enshiense DK69 TaxID=1107311 RepID=V6SJQ5_9FLAO|nr:hypothetical protein [Flavobacterium enshiense]ESU24640.1 hypothetical protein FEDK69T_05630 [Flavobacterium enshiense DK69]KGO95492.1 hypothetical protein Q767_11880 [Flavobacterium enshiense DK69]